jgi:antibiotic biosynthesis monooxygenase (ABM) superfamily enzyme
MKRRTYLRNIVGNILAGTAVAAIGAAAPSAHPIQLEVDLAVDPAKEAQMLNIFHTQFHPAAEKQPGFIRVDMLKLRTVIQPPAPPDCNYRFVLTFQSEELRQKWIKTPIHNQLWPKIEDTLRTKNYNVLLYDVA